LDVATGTGIAALAAAKIVGESGRVAATDVSPSMLDRARERLATFSNASFSVEDGQALRFPDQSFDVVICNMGLMYFPDPAKGMKEFYRVLRKNGRATVSVFHGSGAVYRLSSGREFQGVGDLIAASSPSKALHGGHFRKLGERIADLFAEQGFKEIETEAYSGFLTMSSLDGYVQGIEAGAGAAGAEFLAVAPEVREPVRAELHDLLIESKGEEVQVIVPVMFATGVA
jgi:ubiquinone/menaquinone biosynthesis C-methylase UbiE